MVMRVLILMYHMVSETDHPLQKRYAVSPKKFRWQMRYLKFKGYTPISLDDLHGSFVYNNGKLPEKPVIITFDDGYMDNYENAFPVLKEYSFPAAIFMVSGLVGRSNLWNVAEGYPERPLIGWREAEEMMKGGVTIGSHTINHPWLTQLFSEEAKREIGESKKSLEDRLGMPINHFAYPYGDLNQPIVDIVKDAGYVTACSVRAGFNKKDTDPFILKRIGIYGEDSLWRFALKVTFGTNEGSLSHQAKYYMERLAYRIK
jgi:peptidoglycan/xylan/chitin deacetylase (PgdA/CDA1 family)